MVGLCKHELVIALLWDVNKQIWTVYEDVNKELVISRLDPLQLTPSLEPILILLITKR